MAKITQAGRALCAELGTVGDSLCSELHRLAKSYATIQERWCSEDLSCHPNLEDRLKRREARIEVRITEIVKQLGLKGVKFTGDPRGYTVKVLRKDGEYNTWGGAEEGWGIA